MGAMFATRISLLVLFCGVTVFLLAQSQTQSPQTALPQVVRFASERLAHLASPDDRWTLTNGCKGCPAGQEMLWLVQNDDHHRRLVRKYEHTVQTAWAPDSSAFYLNDESAANKTEAFVVEPHLLKITELEKLIAAADPPATRFTQASHSFLAAQQWLSPTELIVTLTGHFDPPTATQFEVRYRVNLNGRVVKESQRESEWDPDSSPPTE
jgi:hypothetical protein